MGRSTDPGAGLDAATDLVRAQATTWFPDLSDGVVVRAERSLERPRCRLHVLALSPAGSSGGDEPTHRVLVKQRLAVVGHAGEWGSEARPRLATPAGPGEDPTPLEAQGLRTSERMVADAGDPGLRALRLLGHLPEHRTLVVDHIARPTLRDVVHDVARGRVLRRRADGLEPLVERCGTWLRLFHAQPAPSTATARGLEGDQMADLARTYAEFLEARPGTAGLASRLASACGEVLADGGVGPPAVTHGDFAARNVFTWTDPAVAVFDPMPRWRAPAHEDLARFVVDLRSMAVLVTTGGRALGPMGAARCEDALVRGYFGAEPVPWSSLLAHQSLLLLDKWAAAVARPRPRDHVAAAVARTRDVLLVRHVRREAARLLSRAAPTAEVRS